MFALQAVSPQSGPASSILGTIGVLLVVGFFLYLYLGITLMLIARRSNTSYSGLAFLPIAYGDVSLGRLNAPTSG